MLSFTAAVLMGFLVTLMAVSGIRLRQRILRRSGRRVPRVDDAALQRILEEGVLTSDEDAPLDQGEIDDAERRFWSERWDEPEEL